MNKQEQIEEIAQFICGRSTDDICIIDRTSCDCNCAWARTAEAIYNAGYRKIPENAVVLTKEEYIDLSRNYVTEQIKKARKETAKEIVEKVKGQSETFLSGLGNGTYVEKDYVSVEYIEELAKQFGVEVEE